MLIHQLIVLPTPDTIQYLSNVFDGSPIDLDLSFMYVEINSSTEVMEAQPQRLYTATAGTLNKFYDSATGETSLLLPLNSTSLVERAREIREDAPSAFYGDHYFPFLVIKRGLPPLKRHRRGIVTSWSDTLYANQQPLLFDAEIVIPREYNLVPDLGYYAVQLDGSTY